MRNALQNVVDGIEALVLGFHTGHAGCICCNGGQNVLVNQKLVGGA